MDNLNVKILESISIHTHTYNQCLDKINIDSKLNFAFISFHIN